jgi:hypothetical protein
MHGSTSKNKNNTAVLVHAGRHVGEGRYKPIFSLFKGIFSLYEGVQGQ